MYGTRCVGEHYTVSAVRACAIMSAAFSDRGRKEHSNGFGWLDGGA